MKKSAGKIFMAAAAALMVSAFASCTPDVNSGNNSGNGSGSGDGTSGKANESEKIAATITNTDVLYNSLDGVVMNPSSMTMALQDSTLTVRLTFGSAPAMWKDYRIAILIDDTSITSSNAFSDSQWINFATYSTITGNPDFYILETPGNGIEAGFSTSTGVTAKHSWTVDDSYLYTASSTSLTYTIPLTAITDGTESASSTDSFHVTAFLSEYWNDGTTHVVSAIPSAAVTISQTDSRYDTAAVDMENAVCISISQKYSVDVGGTTESVTVTPVNATISDSFMKGFDASAVNDSKELTYYEDDGVKTDVFQVLKNHGYNWVRLRIWNNPDSSKNPSVPGNSDLETVLDEAKRAKAAGLKILLDFHYSDYWTDPGKQLIPEEWLSCTTSDAMAEKVYDYTKEVLTELKEQDTLPDMVQVGNEINTGILVHSALSSSEAATTASSSVSGRSWNDSGSSSTAYTDNFTKYLASGIKAVDEVAPDAKVMLHIAGGGGSIEWLLKIFKNASLDYDVIGLSYYPKESSHGTLSALETNIKNFISTYGKEVVIAETSFYYMTNSSMSDAVSYCNSNLMYNGSIYDGIETDSTGAVTFSYQNQVNVMHAIIEVSAAAGGEGVFYWGGEYKGDWSALFQSNGKPLPSLNAFRVTGK